MELRIFCFYINQIYLTKINTKKYLSCPQIKNMKIFQFTLIHSIKYLQQIQKIKTKCINDDYNLNISILEFLLELKRINKVDLYFFLL